MIFFNSGLIFPASRRATSRSLLSIVLSLSTIVTPPPRPRPAAPSSAFGSERSHRRGQRVGRTLQLAERRLVDLGVRARPVESVVQLALEHRPQQPTGLGVADAVAVQQRDRPLLCLLGVDLAALESGGDV